MKKTIIKWLFGRYKQDFHNLLIEDTLLNLPNKVGKPAIEILGARKESVTKWLNYECSAISRRNPCDFGNLERRNGMLIMATALIAALSNTSFIPEPEEKKPEPKKPDTSWMEGVEAFRKGKKVIP